MNADMQAKEKFLEFLNLINWNARAGFSFLFLSFRAFTSFRFAVHFTWPVCQMLLLSKLNRIKFHPPSLS